MTWKHRNQQQHLNSKTRGAGMTAHIYMDSKFLVISPSLLVEVNEIVDDNTIGAILHFKEHEVRMAVAISFRIMNTKEPGGAALKSCTTEVTGVFGVIPLERLDLSTSYVVQSSRTMAEYLWAAKEAGIFAYNP